MPGLKQAVTSIAYLPIDAVDEDPDEEADSFEAVTAWALSPPGSATRMTAPEFGPRALTGASVDVSEARAPLQKAGGLGFDGQRF